jgi:hypothetical protein
VSHLYVDELGADLSAIARWRTRVLGCNASSGNVRFQMKRTQLALAAAAISGLTGGPSVATADTDNAVEAPGKTDYPQRVIDRPLTLFESMVEPQTLFVLESFFFGFAPDDMDMERPIFKTKQHFGAGLRAGVTDEFTVTAFAGAVGGSEIDYEGFALVATDVMLLESSKTDVALRFAIPMSFDDRTDTFQSLNLGVPTRYAPLSFLAVLVGEELLVIGSDGVTIPLSVGVGGQIWDLFWLRVDTSLGTLTASGDDNKTTFDTFDTVFPVRGELLFAAGNKLDVSAFVLLPNVEDAKDIYSAGASISLRL